MRYDSSIINITNITLDNKLESKLSHINLRYVLSIPFKNIKEGLSITVVMMNPSKANLTESDPSVAKLIDFFSTFSVNKQFIKEVKVVNIFPVCSTKPSIAFEKVKEMEAIGEYKSIRQHNILVIQNELKATNIIVAAWGKPTEGTFPYLFYYREVSKVLKVLFSSKLGIYTFKVEGTGTLLTESNDPRHPAGTYGKAIIGLEKVSKGQLLGF